MKLKIKTIVVLICCGLLATTLALQSCNRNQGKKSVAISTNNNRNSHNNAQNCMNCHRQSGEGAEVGWFVVAGSVYMPDLISQNPNGKVMLYSGQNGTGNLVATIDVDALGNFYTTESIDFGNGLYPAVQGVNGGIKYMGQVTRVGSCNGCHGTNGTDKVWTN